MAARIDVEKKKPVPRFFLYTLISIGCVKTNKPRQKKKKKKQGSKENGRGKEKEKESQEFDRRVRRIFVPFDDYARAETARGSGDIRIFRGWITQSGNDELLRVNYSLVEAHYRSQ